MINHRLAQRRRAAVFVLAALPLAGCSMTYGLAGSTGMNTFSMGPAVVDILEGAKVDILVAPTCTGFAGETITCSPGKTTGGQPITVAVAGTQTPIVTVRVGDKEIFNGSVTDVLNKAGRVDK